MKKFYVMDEDGIFFAKPKIFRNRFIFNIPKKYFLERNFNFQKMWLNFYAYKNRTLCAILSLLHGYFTEETRKELVEISLDEKNEKVYITARTAF